MLPLVSVIIPTRNRAKLLKEALESVYSQEGVGEDFEIEIIVVDDGSSDNTGEVISSYPGIVYIRHEKNRGVAAALNTGIKACHGRYCAFLGDDDIFLPHRIKHHIPVLESNSDLGVAYSQLIVDGIGQGVVMPDQKDAPSGWVFKDFIMKAIMFSQFATIRREAFEKAGLFDESLESMEDYDIFLRLALQVPFQFIPGVVFVYRFSQTGLWFTAAEKGCWENTVGFILEKALAMLPDSPEKNEMRRKACLSWLPEIIHGLKLVKKNDRMREYLVTLLKNNNWVVKESWEEANIVQNSASVASLLSLASDKPFLALREFLSEVKSTSLGVHNEKRSEVNRILSKIWMNAGRLLMESDRRKYHRVAGYAALQDAFNDHKVVCNKFAWKLFLSAIITGNPWGESIIGFFRRKDR